MGIQCAKCGNSPVDITYYKARERKTDASVVIFPGGGYSILAEHEGKDYALFLNSVGMDAFVVNYRLKPDRFPLQLIDARRAIQYVRKYSHEYRLEPNKIAVMGSSAGGHLAALLSTYKKEIAALQRTDVDNEDYTPNAQILCYPVICAPYDDVSNRTSYDNLLGKDLEKTMREVSPELICDETAPQAFIWHTSDDETVNVINSYRYAEALRKNGIPTEMHIYPHGKHGLGLSPENPHVSQWKEALVSWLRYIDWL